MKMIEAKIAKKFILRDEEGKIFTQEFIKGDEYLEEDFTPANFQILSEYKYQGNFVFDVYEKDNSKKEEKKEKEPEITLSDDIEELREAFSKKLYKEVPRNKKNDAEWIKKQILK